jgi:tetratricopeptide (TPR) repeat protein
MLDSVLGNDHRLQFLKQLLIERTEGNPLFLEESIRTLLETKILAGEWGNYHLEKEVVSSEVPATVQAVLAARIDRLPGQQKHVLQAAAVIGKDVPFALLRTITESSDEELRRCIAQLHAAGFFYETGLFPDLQYTFKHALTHEVAYKSLLHERQRALHTQIVKAIETLYSTRLIEQVERLAHHAARGEVWDKALSYLRQAGAKADARSANREARSYFEQALIALGHLPESRETREQAIDLHFALHISLGALGDRERRQAHLQFGEGLANDLGDKRRLAQANVYLARQLMAEGAYGQACIACERTIEMGRTLGDHGLEISGNFYLGLTNYYLGNYSTAAEVLERNLAPFDGVAVRERFGGAAVPLATSRAALALAWAERGQFIKAVAVCRDAIHIAESVGHPFSIAMTYRGMGYVHLRRGDLHQATVTLDYALEIGRGVDNPPLYYTVSSTLGYAYALSGRSAEAILLLEDAVKHPDLAGIQESKSLRELSLSEAYLLAGRELDASAAAQRALDLARQQKERGQEGCVLQLLGEIALEKYSPDFAAAEQNYLQAVTLAEELGMRPLIARCYSGLGKLYRRRGDLQLAKNHFNSGVSMMREMDMGFWLEKAEAELEELGDAVVFQKLRGLG